MNTEPSPTDLAWAAGFLDADGHIGISRNKPNIASGEISPHHKVVMSISQCIPEIVQHFADLFGGTVNQTQQTSVGSPIYQWSAAGANASRILTMILPYLIGKRRQAEVCIELQSRKVGLRTNGARGKPVALTVGEIAARDALHEQSRLLNAHRYRRKIS